MDSNEYHGIIINISQKDKSIFRQLDIIGKKKVLFGFIILYKVRIYPEQIDAVIHAVRQNMVDCILFKKQQFYAHFYRDNELFIVYRDKVFHTTPDCTTWKDAFDYGRKLNIAVKQLDFKPCRFEDETY